ncbi:hypothetical protein FDP25_12995 [Roseovarius sp. A21]|uniref:histidine kinase n=1 Tax=Roseovarius bejariae TaxID=2576383 RepID=A0A844D3C4_9RHOB|nr:hypothetical protein [Roseovarius bejariae]
MVGKPDRLNKVFKPRDFPIAVMIAVTLTILMTTITANKINAFLLRDARQEAVQDASREAEMIARSLQREIIKFEVIAHAIRSVIERHPNLNQQEYQQLVKPLVETSPSIINAARSDGFIVDRVYPFESNQAAIGLDYRDIPDQFPAVNEVLRSGDTKLLGPIDLVQGGTAFIQRSPYYAEEDQNNGGPATGIISLIIDRDRLIAQTMQNHGPGHMDIALRKLNERARPAGLLYGDPTVFNLHPVLRNLPTDTGTWQIGLRPSTGWPQEPGASLAVWVATALAYGLLGFLLLALWTMYRSKSITENQLRSAINSIEDGFALYDKHDRLVFANDKYRSYYTLSGDAIYPGNTFENILRTGLEEGQYDEAIGREEEWLQERLAAHRNPCEPVEQKLADGRWLQIAETRSPEGNTAGFRVDVTELKLAREKAEAANRAKTDFLNIISHELRTPLTSVIGYARFLENLSVLPAFKKVQDSIAKGHEADAQKRALTELHNEIANMSNRIASSSDHLLGLINDILDRAQFEAETIHLYTAQCNLRDIVKSVTKTLELKAAEKGLTLESDVSDVILLADAKRLRQALINVIGNAIKFTETGGVYISSEQDENQIRLTIRDTGCGIGAKDHEDIFDQFVQVDTSVTRRNSGAGLGLAITREIINLHGGDITVDSELGNGSTFTITLPVRLCKLGYAA